MRRLHLRHDAGSIEECAATPPTEAMVTALDAALTFATSRELMTQKQVESLLTMLRVASPLSSEPGSVCDALDHLDASFATRHLISGSELVDHLLDVRLEVRAPLPEAGSQGGAKFDGPPLVAV